MDEQKIDRSRFPNPIIFVFVALFLSLLGSGITREATASPPVDNKKNMDVGRDKLQHDFLLYLIEEAAKKYPLTSEEKKKLEQYKKISGAKNLLDKARTYVATASEAGELKELFNFRAAELYVSLIHSGETLSEEDSSWFYNPKREITFDYALKNRFPNAFLTYFQYETLLGKKPALATLRTALETSSPEEKSIICQWVVANKGKYPSSTQNMLKGSYYAHCYEKESDSPLSEKDWLLGTQQVNNAEKSTTNEGFYPSPSQRLKRAKRLHFAVEYTESLNELNKIRVPNPISSENSAFFCEVTYWKARTIYRLRRRNDAMELYQNVVDGCPKEEGVRVKSLYALGVRAFDTGKTESSKEYFKQLVKEYGHRSHADDALLYLARIARMEGKVRAKNDADEKKEALSENSAYWVKQAFLSHKNGDMLTEIAWEDVEELYREKAYKQFLKATENQPLPEHDDLYYSQGRIPYFRAKSLQAIGEKNVSRQAFIHLLQRYPFSFYGYLAYIELATPTSSLSDYFTLSTTLPSWIDNSFVHSPVFLLLTARLYDDASAFVSTHHLVDNSSYWQAAMIFALAGEYNVSHNIVRRKISGRPWISNSSNYLVDTKSPLNQHTTPISLAQFLIAWPLPYKKIYDDDAILENAQSNAKENPILVVKPSLAEAISREESGFNPLVVSYAGAVGLMQLMPRTAMSHDSDIHGGATIDTLKIPSVNIRVGLDHLHWLARRFDGNPILMIAAYNAGAGAVGKWLRRRKNTPISLFVEDIPYDQTRNYTKRVFGSYMAYQLRESLSAGFVTKLSQCQALKKKNRPPCPTFDVVLDNRLAFPENRK